MVSGLVAAGANILILSELPGDPSEKASQGVNFFELSFHIQRFLLRQLGFVPLVPLKLWLRIETI
jgi:hypothetical protein